MVWETCTVNLEMMLQLYMPNYSCSSGSIGHSKWCYIRHLEYNENWKSSLCLFSVPQTYLSCGCVDGVSTATPGSCPSNCWGIITYMIFLSLGALLGMMASIPGLTVQLRYGSSTVLYQFVTLHLQAWSNQYSFWTISIALTSYPVCQSYTFLDPFLLQDSFTSW